MSRMNVYAEPDEFGADQAELTGWFDPAKADHWDDSDYNGNGSLGTGRGSGLWRTAQGRWVIDIWSRWQGEPSHACTFITPEEARDWLLRNDEDADAAKYFGEVEEERGPGRPGIGEQVCFTVPTEDLALIDSMAKQNGTGRSAALRNAVAAYVEPAKRAAAEAGQ